MTHGWTLGLLSGDGGRGVRVGDCSHVAVGCSRLPLPWPVGEEVVAAGLEVPRAPRIVSCGDPCGDLPPLVPSVKLVELEEANIHDGRVLFDDAGPINVEVPHRFLEGAIPRRPVEVHLACAVGRVHDEPHEGERRRAQRVAEEQSCRLLGGNVALAGN